MIPNSVAMGSPVGVEDGLQMGVSNGQEGEMGAKTGFKSLCGAQADGSVLQTAHNPAWPGHPSCRPVPP